MFKQHLSQVFSYQQKRKHTIITITITTNKTSKRHKKTHTDLSKDIVLHYFPHYI